ncbi:asparaginase [Tersicoccus solisilvae]|uniref:Asparaginase n=1 Tax=Tersicoccus solisilvae TaxID=1882339 RepID=A0ABQ1NMB6_9MICC|nr:asparaginase [Tersicoccus solisilvae]GGC80701.1 asparaginase [Tersicoccus solisilvae]
MPQTFAAGTAVELAVVERSGFIESRHIGAAVVVDAEGAVVLELGDVQAPVFPRSTLKPFQAIASMQAGVPLRGPQVAIAAGSHHGSFEHLDVVEGMLAAAGLGEADLQCPPAWPYDEDARAWLVRTERGKSRLAMECSGKHAAFLWACTEAGWDTGTYLAPEHPLQQRVVKVIEEYARETVAHVGVDGCGAPVSAVSLTGLARAYSALAQAPREIMADARAATVATAMLDYPWAVAGVGAPDTVIMDELGVLTKSGAEGVLALATPSGVTVALKLLDGVGRAAPLVGLSLLQAAGALDADRVAAVLPAVSRPVLGGGEPVGRLGLAQPVAALLERDRG